MKNFIVKGHLLKEKMKKTIENLAKAFVGESQARNRYSFYAKIAQKEGYEKIGEIFLITAENEREHAKVLFKLINELKKKIGNFNEIKIETLVPTIVGTTLENLKSAIEGENYEYTKIYPEFAKIAEKENLLEIAEKLRKIAIAEKHHRERYEKLLKELEQGTIFKKEENVFWVCRKCGFTLEGKEPPKSCPLCNHPKSFFELKCEIY